MTEPRYPSLWADGPGLPAPSHPQTSLREAPPAAPPRAIVVVEDQPDILDILRRFLRVFFTDDAHELVVCANAEQARHAMASRQVRLLITDYNMLDMNGLQLASEFKASSPETFIILMSAYTTPELMAQARRARVDAYLAKPFSLDTMENLLRTALS